MSHDAVQITILGADCSIALSQQTYLRAQGIDVQILDLFRTEPVHGFRAFDIVILNLGDQSVENYTLLGNILKLECRPKLILIMSENADLFVDDEFYGGPSMVLENPKHPTELLNAILAMIA